MSRKRTTNRWVNRRRNVCLHAEVLAEEMGGEFPINLGRIAAKRRIKKIEFQSLLVDGTIRVVDDGFEILVRCESWEGEELTESWKTDGTGSALPAKMRNRARFTVAHEIAHTFFYDVSATPPKPTIRVEHGAAARSLEHACNRAASAMLLPEAALLRDFQAVDWLNPDSLAQMAHKTVVSKAALVERLRHLRRIDHPLGIIASIEYQIGARPVIRSISRHYAFERMFPNAKVGAPLEELVEHPDFCFWGGEREVVAVETAADGPAKTWLCAGERFAKPMKSGAYLLTLREKFG